MTTLSSSFSMNIVAVLLATVCFYFSVLSGLTASLGFINVFPPESPQLQKKRHVLIADRRAKPIVMVHRGMSAAAPENTLEAYAAAMDFGADGCEIDLRRTADGVLVLFHDDMLDRLTHGFGAVNQLTYYELLALEPRLLFGHATNETRPPTFVALLALARQRAMLLHLDVKEPNLDDEIASLLEAADVWDHVIAVNTQMAPKLSKHPKIKMLRYKTGLYQERRDVDPEKVHASLPLPGEMIIVDDPRVAARELQRPAFDPVPLPDGLHSSWPPRFISSTGGDLIPAAHLRAFASRMSDDPEMLLATLATNNLAERQNVQGSAQDQRTRTERILERAWAAQKLGMLGKRSRSVTDRLIFQVMHPSWHTNWMYHGLDGALAARALGEMDAKEFAPQLVAAFQRTDPSLTNIVVDSRMAQYPLAWT
jgi:hypothetical protein